ncbi:tyrosine--tRNA ligase [Azospirillum brasilense]|uniref:Tyrosine--tRNA ligase n=1 Tax=Azospirillum brasilense TaxID=192 RepID=A0A0P0ECI4_AZOBR|nr:MULTISPECIES: tyrosine--tRNA ligase [Azospirillum]ALJ36727.1 tyrosine--tRNA ligase [Azospirillum brasilense]MDW7555939.1 tyrosine--tRNA ligase [Azospirillum brasilense]MDW7595311.1 tyrosine--tRNA ligase [Azospirillum brasilense]MDW7630212.1 tyrosine--tRNA ligase [Azospirillum brasilense]MDX5951667.1 tyrosine--tRNA ligase [Azospirillum brasilense]
MATPAASSPFQSDFLRVLDERGFLHQGSDLSGLDALLRQGPAGAYIGFDATADSLHVGHLVSIMVLRWFQKTGNRPVVLIGGGTTRIGDPSFRDTSRPMLDDAQIAANMAGIGRAFAQYLSFGDEEPNGAVMVDNADWLDELRYIPMLRDIGRHFTVNRMLSFDSVKLRLDREQPLTFLEFNYMILQAFDFLELSRRHGCRLQMGGSDQWGNIVNGIELARRVDGTELFGLTTPLLTTASGAKMGKTAAGAVWLNADRRSPHDFWQFWRNTEDADVGRFLRLFTELPLDEITRLEALQGSEINEAKKILAHEATSLCHGAAAAAEAGETARRVFEEAGAGGGLPTVEAARTDLAAGVRLADLLAAAGLAESKGAARRLIRDGGARVNGTPVTDEAALLTPANLDGANPDGDGLIRLSAGRKRHALVRVR